MPWLRWLLSAFSIAFPVLYAVYLLRDRPHAFAEALAWGAITAFAFMLAQVRRVRRKQSCAVCEAFSVKTGRPMR